MFFKSPLELYIDITAKCNLHCNFCMREWEPYLKHKDNPMLINSLKEIIVKYDIPNIIITGGEPFLSWKLLPFVKFLKENGKRVHITTNGTLANRNNLAQLKKYGIDLIQVSIHGYNGQLNDKIMGKTGSFRKILNTLELLQEFQIPFSTKTTITKDNIKYFHKLYELLKNYSLKQMIFTEVFYIGKAVYGNLKPTYNDLLEMKEKIDGLNDERINFQSETLSFYENHFPTKCTIGDEYTTSLEILADGTVLPCAYSVVFDEHLNIFDKNFRDIWGELSIYKKYLTLPDDCRDCSLKETCLGGCPARRKVFGTKRDPMCLIKEVSR
ncbi:radical SAM protein [bacterium]|nr:radical SAM protein [bacterium]